MTIQWSSDLPTRCDLNAPSPWAPGLTNRQAIRLADLRETHGMRGLGAREDAERWALEAEIGRALHGEALEENAERDSGMVWLS